MNEAGTSPVVRVALVDDHAVVREGLKRIISENPGMAVTGEAGDGYEAMNAVKSNPCRYLPHREGSKTCAIASA